LNPLLPTFSPTFPHIRPLLVLFSVSSIIVQTPHPLFFPASLHLSLSHSLRSHHNK
jgi:hypothetical protein